MRECAVLACLNWVVSGRFKNRGIRHARARGQGAGVGLARLCFEKRDAREGRLREILSPNAPMRAPEGEVREWIEPRASNE